jgi:hypothetical protein
VAAWVLLAGAAAAWLARVASGRGGDSPARTLAAIAGLLLAGGLALERWPIPFTAPRFHESIAVAPEVVAFFDGRAVVKENEALLHAGGTTLLVRAPGPVPSIRAILGGRGFLRLKTGGVLTARPAGAVVDLPLAVRHTVRGPHGETETFGELRLTVEGEALLRFGGEGAGPRQ